jgi:hypothetical protein
VGFVLAFGESVGLPGTDRRLPLPLEGLRTVAPPFQAFRGAWRFSWLLVVAVAWWAAVGVEGLVAARRRILGAACIALLTLVSLPGGVPAREVALTGRPVKSAEAPPGAVATLPAPRDEYAEDVTEALWLARALAIQRPVTGGATGWVPPEIVALRSRLEACEEGREDPAGVIAEWRAAGIRTVEIALRPDDPRVAFWRGVLASEGATRISPWPQPGYETWRLPD